MSERSDVSSELREYGWVVWTRKWSILLVTGLLVVVATLYSSQQTRIYRASAEVLVRPVNLSPTDPSSIGDFMNMEPERRLATSVEVAKLAQPSLRGLRSTAGVSVSAPDRTNTLVFNASSPDPRTSQRTAQAYAEAYLKFRLQQVLDDLRAASQPLQERIDDLNGQIDDVQSDLSAATTESERTALQIRSNSLFSQRTFLEQKLNELVLPENLQVGKVLQPAGLPSSPVSPNVPRAAALALLLGLAVGVAQAFVRNRLDQRVRSRHELEAGVGAPVLAVVPHHRFTRSGGRDIVTLSDPDGAAAQSYKMLRATVLFIARSSQVRTLMVTSATAGEGKTITVANLAVALAQSGQRVAMVSADLHRPMLESLFDLSDLQGLGDVMWGRCRVSDVLVPLRGDRLQLLPSGSARLEGSELLGTEAMSSVLAGLAAVHDIVLVDTPPVLSSADALNLAPLVDAVVLVADARQATYEMIQEARARLDHVGANVIGAVLNNLDGSHSRWEGYYALPTQAAPGAGEWSA